MRVARLKLTRRAVLSDASWSTTLPVQGQGLVQQTTSWNETGKHNGRLASTSERFDKASAQRCSDKPCNENPSLLLMKQSKTSNVPSVPGRVGWLAAVAGDGAFNSAEQKQRASANGKQPAWSWGKRGAPIGSGRAGRLLIHSARAARCRARDRGCSAAREARRPGMRSVLRACQRSVSATSRADSADAGAAAARVMGSQR